MDSGPDGLTSRILPWPVLRELVPYTRQHLARLEKRGEFPKRLQVGPGRVGWLEHEIAAWIGARAAARPAGGAVQPGRISVSSCLQEAGASSAPPSMPGKAP